MRRTFLLVALLILVSLTVFVPTASAVSLGANYFYDDLAPYGDWFQMEDHGWVWTPRSVAADWRPYTRGHWAYTDDDGWLWLSDEDFGWATYHYGRWFYDGDYGWVWVPGEQWAPSWVSWRLGEDYAGWAPLPPEYDWRAGGGQLPGGIGMRSLAPTYYVFVPARDLVAPVVYRHVVPYDRNESLVRVTRDVTRYETVGDRIVSRAIPAHDVERVTGRAVPRYRVEVATSAPRRPVVQGNTVKIFRPSPQQIARAPRKAAPTAVPRVKPHPAAPPADPRAVRIQRPPTTGPAPGGAADRQHERERQQERARQQHQEKARRQQAARERDKEQARQQHQEQVREQQAAREREKERARQQHQEQVRAQQEARQREQEEARRQQQERIRQQQLARHREQEKPKQQPPTGEKPSDERRLRAQPQVPDPNAVDEQQRARERAEKERERQKREQQARKKPKPPDQPKPPEKPES
jgi:hypothetical protein